MCNLWFYINTFLEVPTFLPSRAKDQVYPDKPCNPLLPPPRHTISFKKKNPVNSSSLELSHILYAIAVNQIPEIHQTKWKCKHMYQPRGKYPASIMQHDYCAYIAFTITMTFNDSKKLILGVWYSFYFYITYILYGWTRLNLYKISVNCQTQILAHIGNWARIEKLVWIKDFVVKKMALFVLEIINRIFSIYKDKSDIWMNWNIKIWSGN